MSSNKISRIENRESFQDYTNEDINHTISYQENIYESPKKTQGISRANRIAEIVAKEEKKMILKSTALQHTYNSIINTPFKWNPRHLSSSICKEVPPQL